MLGEWLNSKHSLIGVDFGASGVKMLQYTQSGGRMAANASGHFVLPDGTPAGGREADRIYVEAIQRMLVANPFRGNRAVVSLLDQDVQIKNTRLPQMPAAELAEAARWDAVERMNVDIESVHLDYLNAGEVRQGEQVRDELILMACTNKVLQRRVEMLAEAGLMPVAMEPSVVSLGRVFSQRVRRQEDNDTVHAYIDIGLSGSKVILMRGRRIVFFKHFELGGATLNQSVADHLNLSVADAAELRLKMQDRHSDSRSDESGDLVSSTRRESIQRAVAEAVRPIHVEMANEVGLCLRYFAVTFHGSRPDRVCLVGGESHDPALAEVFSDTLNAQVVAIDPLEGVDLCNEDVSIERRAGHGGWAVAMGLALRQPPSAGARLRGAA